MLGISRRSGVLIRGLHFMLSRPALFEIINHLNK